MDTKVNDTKLEEFVTVIQLVNCYFAMHQKGSNSRQLASYPFEDIKAAQVAAQKFAEMNHISYDEKLRYLTPPPITVIRQGSDWYPAELNPHGVSLVTHFGTLSLCSHTFEQAKDKAESVARINKTDFHPELGSCLQL